MFVKKGSTINLAKNLHIFLEKSQWLEENNLNNKFVENKVFKSVYKVFLYNCQITQLKKIIYLKDNFKNIKYRNALKPSYFL